MKINCIAVDDEPPALLQIKEYASRTPFLNLLASFNDPIECVGFMKTNRVDLMFLDIEMGDFSGIQLLNSLNAKPKVVFTTAHKSYAHKAFDMDVTDFLLKPISFERFIKAVDKVASLLIGGPDSVQSANNSVPKDHIFVKTNYKLQRILLNDILYIEGLSEYSAIKTPDEKIITYQSLKNFEQILADSGFMRVHKSFIVRLDRIDTIDKQSIKISGKEIPIGDKFRKAIFEKIKNSSRT